MLLESQRFVFFCTLNSRAGTVSLAVLWLRLSDRCQATAEMSEQFTSNSFLSFKNWINVTPPKKMLLP